VIDFKETFEELKDNIALYCVEGMDARALIFTADAAVHNNMSAVLCDLESVNMLWTWLEKSNVKIFARIIADEFDSDIQKITAAIHSAFKKGANGVHLIATPEVHEKLVTLLAPISSDLFFNKELILSLYLKDVFPSDYSIIFQNIQKIGATGLGLIIENSEDTSAEFYGIIDSDISDFQGSLHIVSRDFNPQIIENIWRITKKMRPELIPSTIFFIKNSI
jgi:hypothetical protein